MDNIKVWAANPDLIKVLRHPSGHKLTAEGTMWPNDRFTMRRLTEGSLVTEQPKILVVLEEGEQVDLDTPPPPKQSK